MGLMAVLLPVLAILAAFCINLAQIQLTRTELTIATDAAARAGGRAFSEIQTVEAAKTAAATTAAMNSVNGEPLILNSDDGANEMEFGRARQPDGVSGRYLFEKIPTASVQSKAEFASAFRVHGRRDTDSLSGSVDLFVPGLLSKSQFETNQQSVAMQVDRDISLVLDRSGSMGTVDFDWPPGISPWNNTVKNAAVSAGILRLTWSGFAYTSGNNSTTFQQWAWEDFFELGPAPQRPWDDLIDAVNAFLDVLAVTSQEEQVSVASYSNWASLDSWLEKDHSNVRSTILGLNVGGATGIGNGMQEGMKALLDSAARPFAAKTMVVMTDGIHNSGISPVSVANSLIGSYNLTIHTVTFGSGADESLMGTVADIGGGDHYHADDADELITIFEEIANNLPTILTQ